MKTKEEIQNELNKLNTSIIETYEKIVTNAEEEKKQVVEYDETTGIPVQSITKNKLKDLIHQEAVKMLTEKANCLKWALDNYEKACEFSQTVKELKNKNVDIKHFKWIIGNDL